MTASLSDIAAMGGKPLWALVSLAVEPETPVSAVEDLYGGLREAAEQAGVIICGGNTSRSPAGVFLDVTAVGECESKTPIVRSGAQPGDIILLTGSLGAARAGLALLERGYMDATNRGGDPLRPRADQMAASPLPTAVHDIPDALVEEALRAFLEPQGRCREGTVLGEAGVANSMIDLSDGLRADLGHICAASDVGARLESDAVPVAHCCQVIAAALGENALAWALEGGEDYELLFTCPPETSEDARQLVHHATGTQVTAIGVITDGDGIVLHPDPPAPGAGGFTHF